MKIWLLSFGAGSFIWAAVGALRDAPWTALTPWLTYSFLCLLVAACLEDDKRKG